MVQLIRQALNKPISSETIVIMDYAFVPTYSQSQSEGF
ncbi:hypothetical protein SDE12394_10240 [Streptococcus dysgalactiae subsp. equisimilis ATCC 12394]|nr:hypothetical protein SDE12394_10240 [Streptococcus dysgalactiae subsp. equisimilis ATCC 12394]